MTFVQVIDSASSPKRRSNTSHDLPLNQNHPIGQRYVSFFLRLLSRSPVQVGLASF